MIAIKRYWLVVGSVLGLFLTAYLLVEAVGVAFLEDPRPALSGRGASAAVAGVGLLVADALLPIPASLVMISLGSLFGAGAGILLALTGRFAMAIVGFWLGRRGGPLLRRIVPEWERTYAEGLVRRWGAVAIIASRPVPLLAETVVVVAGASGLRWRVALLASFLGSVPEAVAYGLTGALAASFDNAAAIWIGFLAVAILFRLVERRQRLRARPAVTTG